MNVRTSAAITLLLLCIHSGPAAAEPVLWPKSEGGNDHYYDFDDTGRSLEEARAAAAAVEPPEGYGEGHVVTITSSAEQAFLATEFPPLASCMPFSGPCIWTALSDEANEGTFVWLDGPEAGLTLSQAGYSNWSGGEPNNSGAGEDCAIYGWNGTSQWNDVGCAGPNLTIIEWEPLLEPKLVLWPSAEGGNDHYYYLDVTVQTLADARAGAPLLEQPDGYGEGYLVTVTSAEEQAFLAEEFPPLETCKPFSGPCIWLGTTDEQTEGQFQWLDGPEAGMTLGYSNWFSGEPNNASEEDCVIYGWSGTTQWNDVGCGGLSISIVEFDIAPPTTTTLPAGLCGDPVAPVGVTAPDALYVLRSAVGTLSCEICVCDVDDNGTITATDALRTLRHAVGQNVELDCPACG